MARVHEKFCEGTLCCHSLSSLWHFVAWLDQLTQKAIKKKKKKKETLFVWKKKTVTWEPDGMFPKSVGSFNSSDLGNHLLTLTGPCFEKQQENMVANLHSITFNYAHLR